MQGNFNPQAYGASPDMLTQFKYPYQMPQIGMPMTPMMPSQPKPTEGFIWVQGEAGAKAYLVAPNNTVMLWDSENPIIYVKSADASGMPSMKILDFVERKPTEPKNATDKYVTTDQFEMLKSELESLKKNIEGQVIANG
jgi:hypothetical protein